MINVSNVDDKENNQNVNEMERKKTRVANYLKKTQKYESPLRHELDPRALERSEENVSLFVSFKESIRDKVMNEKLFQPLSRHKSFDIRQGEPTFFTINLKNSLKNDEIFTVNVLDQVPT